MPHLYLALITELIGQAYSDANRMVSKILYLYDNEYLNRPKRI